MVVSISTKTTMMSSFTEWTKMKSVTLTNWTTTKCWQESLVLSGEPRAKSKSPQREHSCLIERSLWSNMLQRLSRRSEIKVMLLSKTWSSLLTHPKTSNRYPMLDLEPELLEVSSSFALTRDLFSRQWARKKSITWFVCYPTTPSIWNTMRSRWLLKFTASLR